MLKLKFEPEFLLILKILRNNVELGSLTFLWMFAKQLLAAFMVMQAAASLYIF